MFLFFHCKITVNEICLECRLCRLPMIIDAITANPWGFNCTKLAVNSCNLLILRTKRVIFNLGLWTNKACRSNIPRHFSSFDVPGFTWPQGVTSQKKKTTEKNNNNNKKNSSVPGNLHLHLKNTKNLHKLHQTLWVCMNISKASALSLRAGTRRVATFPVLWSGGWMFNRFLLPRPPFHPTRSHTWKTGPEPAFPSIALPTPAVPPPPSSETPPLPPPCTRWLCCERSPGSP